MPTDLPIACSLSASEAPQRLEEMADLGRAALVDAHTESRRAQLRFAAGVGVRDRVLAVAAAESECCAFLTIHVTNQRDTVVLTIDAPEGAESVLAELVDAFRCQPEPPAKRPTTAPPGPAGTIAA
jgi:hypothetical protein